MFKTWFSIWDSVLLSLQFFKSIFFSFIWLYWHDMWSAWGLPKHIDKENSGLKNKEQYRRKKSVSPSLSIFSYDTHLLTRTHRHIAGTGAPVWLTVLSVHFNMLMLYYWQGLLPQKRRARWELAKWYSCLFRCSVSPAQQTQALLPRLHCRLWVGIPPFGFVHCLLKDTVRCFDSTNAKFGSLKFWLNIADRIKDQLPRMMYCIVQKIYPIRILNLFLGEF